MTWLLFAQFCFLCLLVADTLKAALCHKSPTNMAISLFDAMAADGTDPKGKKIEHWRSVFDFASNIVSPAVGLLFFTLLIKAGCEAGWSLAWAGFYAAQVVRLRHLYRNNTVAANMTHNFWSTLAINTVETAILWKAGLFWGLL